METPSQPSLSRLALGALDVNQRLHSPRKSPSKKHSIFVFDNNAAEQRPVTYSLKEQVLEASLPRSRPASPLRAAVSPRRNEKRKAETALLRDAEEALRHAKYARVEERERTAVGHGHVLGKEEREVADVVGMEEAEEDEQQVSCAGLVDLGQRTCETYQLSQEGAAPRSPEALFDVSVGQDDSQLTNITEPDVGPHVPSPTVSELRENAQALRLRLQFAMYKLKTNQLDIPLSRLELLPPTPALPPVASPSKFDDELPNTQLSAPSPSEPASPQAPVPATASASPSNKDVDVEMPTPTPLPTHTQDATTESEPCEDPASSVVKDHAADGLLSLMGSIQPQ